MKFTIEIDEKELEKRVLEMLVRNATQDVEEMLNGNGYHHRRDYTEAIKDAVRETVKKNADDIINRAVDAGGLYIGKKGLKKMIDEDAI